MDGGDDDTQSFLLSVVCFMVLQLLLLTSLNGLPLVKIIATAIRVSKLVRNYT
jgi:hypothetical protein